MKTNRERLQQNNAKIEAIQQTLASKVGVSGEIEITENGVYDVAKYASANVSVAGKENLDTELSLQDEKLIELEKSVDDLPDKDIDLSQTTATAKDVRKGKKFFDANGEEVTGTNNTIAKMMMSTEPFRITAEDMEEVDGAGLRDYCFYDCGLESIDWGNCRPVSIRKYMFASSCYLKSITIPSSVTKILLNAFDRCGIESITFEDGSALSGIEQYAFTYSKLKSITIPDNVTSIGISAFDSCKSLESVYFGNSQLAEISNGCFGYCTALVNIEIPRSVTILNQYCFRECKALPSIVLPNTLTRIDKSIFYTCTGLETITCEKGFKPTTLNASAFTNIANLKNLTLRNVQTALTLSGSPLLTLESLLNTIQELWTTTSSKTLTIGSTNIEKLTDVCVKLVDITDEMRADDQYIDNKAPFVQCESTDEGAMLVTEYVTTIKNWKLA